MRFFFASKQFKIILAIVTVVIAVSIFCIVLGGRISPQSDIIGTFTAPFKEGFATVSNAVSDFVSAYTEGEKAMLENAELKAEMAKVREKVADYDKILRENEFYKEFLEIKEANPDFKFTPATKISRDKLDPYKGFVINKGTTDGLEEYDTVITSDGLVGYISEVGLTTSKVSTILSPDITLGALSNRTNDSGVISGSLDLAEKGFTKFYNLSRSCNIAVGDYAITSGEGIFPSGILIGEVKSVSSDEYNTSIYAEIKPFADFKNLKDVMVITDFKGDGGLTLKNGD